LSFAEWNAFANGNKRNILLNNQAFFALRIKNKIIFLPLILQIYGRIKTVPVTVSIILNNQQKLL
ncbi:hypothetical protein, partial [Chryseobacterium sp. CCH4-E10]|uniref:hypothetical protein n=1 Tax=Chryseobacterium sp. CCH4-E10 TaxID=1768758 RepID=UPI001E652169